MNLSSSQDTERSLAECMREKQFRNLFFGVEKLATEDAKCHQRLIFLRQWRGTKTSLSIRDKIKQMLDYNLNEDL